MGAARGPGDYHGTMSRAELEREAGGAVFSGARSQETLSQVENTRYRGQAGGNAGETYSSSSSGRASSAASLDENDVVVTKGGRWVWSEVSNKWEWEEGAGGGARGGAGGGAGGGQQSSSGSDDSGWVQQSDGTWARKQSSWSQSSQSSVRQYEGAGRGGGVGTGAVLSGEAGAGAGEWSDQGTNSTGWVTRPDGTMVKKSSSWASWSSSSYDDLPGGNSLDQVQRQLEQRVRSGLDTHLPSNVEPGFETEYRNNRRNKRNAAAR